MKDVSFRAVELGAKHLVIVDNGSNTKTKKIIQDLKSTINKTKKCTVHIVTNLFNEGSAGGFKAGIKFAAGLKDISHILLLDDDNLLSKNAVKELNRAYHDLEVLIPGQDIKKNVFFCLRHFDKGFLTKTDQQLDLYHLERDICLVNSYCYFSLEKVLRILIYMLTVKPKPNNKHYYETVAGPYGGMFFHKSLVNDVGLPDEDMFLYFDDIDFTYRAYKKGYKLYLCANAVIDDLDFSYTNKDIKTYFAPFKILENIHDSQYKKLFFGYRNKVYIERKHMIKEPWAYHINRIIFRNIIFPGMKLVYFLKYKNTREMDIMKCAIDEGEKLWRLKR